MDDYESGGSTQCPICYSTDMQWIGGSLSCMVCGSQSQDFAMETQEFQQGIDDQRFRRRAQTAPLKRVTQRDTEVLGPYPASEIIHTYVQCLMLGLKEQMQTLVVDMKMHPDATDIAFSIWTAALKACRVLEAETAERLAHLVARHRAKADTGNLDNMSDKDSSDDDVGPLKHVQPQSTYVQFVWRVLPPETIISCALLAAVVLREAIMPSDLVRWTLSGRLPLLALPHVCRSALAHAPQQFLLPFLQPSGLRDAHIMELSSAQLAATIGLQLPPLNVPALLQRASIQLALPDAVWVSAVQLWHVVREGDNTCRLSTVPTTQPYAHALAPLVVAAKLLYGLGTTAPSHTVACHVPPAPASWQQWAESALDRLSFPCEYPLSVEQALSLAGENRQLYSQYLRTRVFGQVALQPELQVLADALDAITVKKMVAQSSRTHSHNSYDRSNGSSGLATTAPLRTNDSGESDQLVSSQLHAALKSAKVAHVRSNVLAAPSQTASDLSDSVRPVSQSGVPCVTSNVHNERSRNVCFGGHPDYLAVLVAVASHGWAMPRFLDRLAMDFEQDLVEAEVELDRQGP